MTHTLRLAEIGDLDKLEGAWTEFAAHASVVGGFEGPGVAWADGGRDVVAQFIARRGVLLADVDGAVAGVVLFARSELWFRPGVSVLVEVALWVEGWARGRGVAKALINGFEAVGRQEGVAIVSMSALGRAQTDGAHGLMLGLGYAPFETSYLRVL